MAAKIHGLLAKHDIVQIDCPVSGGVGGAEKGTLAVMVSGPKADFELLKPALDVIGKVFFIGEKPGAAQTMKLANNFLSATAMVATSEAVVMGVKAGLDPAVMIDVINAGSGMNTASRDKFPRAVLPRTFDFGFATGLMVKDVRLALEEMKQLGLSMEVADAVGRLWETVISAEGPSPILPRRSSRSRRRRVLWSAAGHPANANTRTRAPMTGAALSFLDRSATSGVCQVPEGRSAAPVAGRPSPRCI